MRLKRCARRPRPRGCSHRRRFGPCRSGRAWIARRARAVRAGCCRRGGALRWRRSTGRRRTPGTGAEAPRRCAREGRPSGCGPVRPEPRPVREAVRVGRPRRVGGPRPAARADRSRRLEVATSRSARGRRGSGGGARAGAGRTGARRSRRSRGVSRISVRPSRVPVRPVGARRLRLRGLRYTGGPPLPPLSLSPSVILAGLSLLAAGFAFRVLVRRVA
jgi:hypothetical protein